MTANMITDDDKENYGCESDDGAERIFFVITPNHGSSLAVSTPGIGFNSLCPFDYAIHFWVVWNTTSTRSRTFLVVVDVNVERRFIGT